MVNFIKIIKKTKKIQKTTTTRSFVVGTGNIISQLFFFWVFIFIFLLRRTKDISKLYLVLRKNDTAAFNDELLEKKWEEEKKMALKQNR